MSSYLRRFINLFKNKASSKVLEGKTFHKAPVPIKPCIKKATKEVKEIGWMQQPVVKNPPRFRVEQATSSDCKFASFLTCHTELITDQDPLQFYSNYTKNATSEKVKRLSPIDEFIRATSIETNCASKFDLRMKTFGKFESMSNMNKAISKFQNEQSRLQRKKFTSSHKCQQQNKKSFSEPVLASPASENHRPNSSEVLFFLPFKAKVSIGSRYLQTRTSKTNQAEKETDKNSKFFHRAPILYNKNAWLNHLQFKNMV